MAEPPRRCNAAAWFVDRHVAVARGDRTALVADGHALPYRTVFENVNRTGHALRRLGVGMGDRVLLLLPDVPEFAYCFWGAIKLGAVPIPTNTLLTPRDYEYILRDSRAVAAIVSASLLPAIAEVRPRLGFLRHVAVVGEAARDTLAFADLIRAEPTELAPAPTTRDDPAFWLYTSGTTGTPKAAALLQVPDAERRYDLRSIRVCVSAGEPLPKALYERWLAKFGLEILDGIGSTELCHTFIANRRGRVRPGSSGTLVPGYDARIVDDAGRDLAPGEVGNLLVRGDSACAGYWNQPERTGQTFLGEWVRTGDKYSRDGDGYFWYAGRSDDMIKAGGMWVSPVEVEGALAEHDAVLEAGVVGAPDTDELTKPLALIMS